MCFLLIFIRGLNQYLGCFNDQIDNRDLEIFISNYERITPQKCIAQCQQLNYHYAGIQSGRECRCSDQYGKYGQVSDDECDFLCINSEKCGGDNRNSIYDVINTLDLSNTGGCFFVYCIWKI